VVISEERFDNLARAKLNEAMAEIGEARRYEIKTVRLPQNVRAPAGNIELEVTLPNQVRYQNTTQVYVSVYANGTFFRRAICYYKIHVYDNVLVAAHDLPLEKVLTASDFRTEEREIENRAKLYPTKVDDVVGMVPSRVIKEGNIIFENMLQNPIVMEVGAPINLVLKENGIEITTAGIAMQRGRVGKVIRVRNASSAKVMRGRVVDASTVEII